MKVGILFLPTRVTVWQGLKILSLIILIHLLCLTYSVFCWSGGKYLELRHLSGRKSPFPAAVFCGSASLSAWPSTALPCLALGLHCGWCWQNCSQAKQSKLLSKQAIGCVAFCYMQILNINKRNQKKARVPQRSNLNGHGGKSIDPGVRCWVLGSGLPQLVCRIGTIPSTLWASPGLEGIRFSVILSLRGTWESLRGLMKKADAHPVHPLPLEFRVSGQILGTSFITNVPNISDSGNAGTLSSQEEC